MISSLKNILIVLIINQLLITSTAFSSNDNENESDLKISDLALPSEVKNIKKNSGSVFYSPTSKGKALIPVHFWGEFSQSGLHYIPINTTLIKGLSLAGGPRSEANLEKVRLTRSYGSKSGSSYKFDLTKGDSIEASKMVLKPGDTIFISKSRFYQNRAYYTSLFGVIATVLSSILLYREVRKN